MSDTAVPKSKLWLILIFLGFFGFLILDDAIANIIAITLGFGLNNNGTTITTFGNISINTSVIQTRLINCSSGMASNSFADNGSTGCINVTGFLVNNSVWLSNSTTVFLNQSFAQKLYVNGSWKSVV